MTEFQQFLDGLKRCGIPHSINWQPDPKKTFLQDDILRARYNITSGKTVAVLLNGTYYVFSVGQPIWAYGVDRGFGPPGAFLLSKPSSGGAAEVRRIFYESGTGPFTGARAIVHQYPEECRGLPDDYMGYGYYSDEMAEIYGTLFYYRPNSRESMEVVLVDQKDAPIAQYSKMECLGPVGDFVGNYRNNKEDVVRLYLKMDGQLKEDE